MSHVNESCHIWLSHWWRTIWIQINCLFTIFSYMTWVFHQSYISVKIQINCLFTILPHQIQINCQHKIQINCLQIQINGLETDFEIPFSVLIEMFVTSISIRGTFKSFWDLTEVSKQSWYKVLTYKLVNPTFKIRSNQMNCLFMILHNQFLCHALSIL